MRPLGLDVVFLALFFCCCCLAPCQCAIPTTMKIQNNSFLVGRRLAGDEEIEQREESLQGKPDYVFTYSKTYVGNNEYHMTQIDVKDIAKAGAYAAIVAGGPGHTFVTLGYTIPRYTDMRFRVTIRGKRPPFRKIP
ncbi:uncharacterized protein LOC106657832 [Trichogramma pretiosum]|uniref:uncharacterized protein LOC106657832 n=1 Tax=Trichogramma pretiosum TaxID=7493 RepID=UPI0006C9D0D8|nr:uncharacterized protein LOC106657832 [Trichogramma pretiosum]